MVLRAIDKLIVQRMNPANYSTAGRVFLSSMQGVRSPVTERNFSPDELGAMQRLIQQKGGGKYGAINYRDYDALADGADTQGMASMNTPLGNVRTTLGQFRYQYDPQQGRYQIQDTYDFNDASNSMSMEGREGGLLLDPKYYAARWYAGETLPPGEGRDVRVALPPTPYQSDTPNFDRLKQELAADAVRERLQKRK